MCIMWPQHQSKMADTEIKPKQIIGVPVLPIPGGRASIGSDISSPSWREEAQEVNSNIRSNSTWSLQHIDFLPRLVKSKKDEDYESFRSVVSSINDGSDVLQCNVPLGDG